MLVAMLIPGISYASAPAGGVRATDGVIVRNESHLGPMAEGDRYAIIIGISDYSEGSDLQLGDLEFADDDALEMRTTLIERYGYDAQDMQLLMGGEETLQYPDSKLANRDNIMVAIESIREKAKSEDEVVFFYSGHGAQGRADDGDREVIDEAIVPWEATRDCLFWDGELKESFSDFPTSRIVFIFDSCFAGGMTDLEAPGRVICMATTEDGIAAEHEMWEGHGQFTFYFVMMGMHYGYADVKPAEGRVTVEEAFDYARSNVLPPQAYAVSGFKPQRPVISDSFAGDLML